MQRMYIRTYVRTVCRPTVALSVLAFGGWLLCRAWPEAACRF